MYKKVLKVAFVAAIAIVSGINVFNSQKSEVLSDIAMENVEALADIEVVPGYTGPAEIFECTTLWGTVVSKGIICKCEKDNKNPCSAVICF